MSAQSFGRYTLEHLLAVGGMGEVYVAVDHGTAGAGPSFQKPCVIKRILPHLSSNAELVAMFSREAALAAQLSHSNVVQIHDHGLIQGHYFIAMEYVQGLDLKAFLDVHRQRSTPVPLGEVVFLVSCVARALDYAHRAKGRDGKPLGIVHRDISPQNVLLSQEGDVKLTDFGVVKACGLGGEDGREGNGILQGKLAYLSPEQASGAEVDARCDVFALGIVLHEALTLRHPFRQEGDTGLKLLDRIKRCEVEAPSLLRRDVPPALDAVTVRCLAREPDARFASAAELLDALEEFRVSQYPQAGAASMARYLRATCPAPVVPPAVAKATGAFLASEAARGGTQESASPVGRALISPVKEPREAAGDALKPTVHDRPRPNRPDGIPPPAPDAGPAPVEQPAGPGVQQGLDLDARGEFVPDEPPDISEDGLDPARARGRSTGLMVGLFAVGLAGGAAVVAFELHTNSQEREIPVGSAPLAPVPPVAKTVPDQGRSMSSLRPTPAPRGSRNTTSRPANVPERAVVPVESRPVDNAPSLSAAPASSMAAPSSSPAAIAAPVEAPDASVAVTPVVHWEAAPASPGLPPSSGLRFTSTRKVMVKIDGMERVESIQGALELDGRSHVIQIDVGTANSLTLFLGPQSTPGRILRAESLHPLRVEVDGAARGWMPLPPYTSRPKGSVLAFSGPGYAFTVSVR